MTMSAFLAYSLTASIIMAMLFLVLHQLVNRCTSFRFNRFSLLCGIILSLVLPAVLLSWMPHSSTPGKPVEELAERADAGNVWGKLETVAVRAHVLEEIGRAHV